MAVQTNTYTGLRAAVLSWIARPTDTVLDARFDDFLQNAEQRMYYGYATEDVGNPLRSDPLRIPEMEVVDPSFALDGAVSGDSVRVTQAEDVRVTEDAAATTAPSGSVGQPTDFLELISARLNSNSAPLQIVAQRILDGYGTQSVGGVKMIAVSGTNFRVLDAPAAGDTATIRYYQKLDTPTAQAVNDILDRYPNVYLWGCLAEAAIYMQDAEGAQRYLQLYNASVSGLNARTQRITASSVPVIRLRVGMTP